MATLDPIILEKYAIAATASYTNQPVPLGMEILTTFESPDNTGLAATAFRDTTTGQIVISLRGTDDLKDLTGADLALALQNLPDQYREAAQFFKDIQDNYGNDIVVTGHSLGAALAQLLGAAEGVTAYGYNGPGVLEILQTDPYFAQQFANVDPASFSNIWRFRVFSG